MNSRSWPGDQDASAAFVAALPGPVRQALPNLLMETGSSTAREDLAAFSAVFGAALRATKPPPGIAEYKRELAAPTNEDAAWQRLALLKGSGAPSQVLAQTARVVLDRFAADPGQDWYGGGLDEYRAYGLPGDSVALALQVIADDPVAVRSVFAEMGRPAVELTRPERITLLFEYARRHESDMADVLGRALATGSGVDHELPGAHSADAAAFAFDTITATAAFGQDIPDAAQDSMAELAASYGHEMIAGATIGDGAFRALSARDMAIATHATNFPGTDHWKGGIRTAPVERWPWPRYKSGDDIAIAHCFLAAVREIGASDPETGVGHATRPVMTPRLRSSHRNAPEPRRG